MDTQKSPWHNFFNACLQKRIPPDKFRMLVKAFQSKNATPPGRQLVHALLAEGRETTFVDPRLPLYTRELLQLKSCSGADVLSAMLSPLADDGSNTGLYNAADQSLPEMEGVLKPSVEALILQMLTMQIVEGFLQTTDAVEAVLKTLVVWMTRFPGSSALGYLVSATFSSPLAQDTMGSPSMKETKICFGRCLSMLISRLTQTHYQLATTLNFCQNKYDIHDEVSGQTLELLDSVDLGALSFQESVGDNASVNTRAGLYVYLNAMLYGRPLFDDISAIEYLSTRYKGDIATLVTDLILASFDILANAMYRTESTESITLLRSFLVNKLPAFLTNYAALIFEPLSIEYCISQALIRVDPAAFPSFSQMFDMLGRSGMLSEARQEFLFACALHQLIPEQSIEVLLGDVPMQSLPASGRYAKDDLVAQCFANPAKIEEFIGELENMEGNAGEIAAALLEIIHNLCTNNDTMTLKGVCNALSRKPLALDVVMLFTQPTALLQPLCHILDGWQDHEDQGEYQPVYDEFGSILLFIVLVKYRFNLLPYDLGIDSPNSFVLKYFKNACMPRPLDHLSELESKLLGGWIRGLFETECISDELMSTCSPKDFHLLVATLFDQSLRACQAKVLALETLRGGLEYLLEPFLLPSLAAGLIYFAHRIWETTEPSAVIEIAMPALHTLLRPPSMSPDSAAMHSAVLSIVAKPLEDAFAYAQRQHPLRADIGPLIDSLKPHAHKQRHEAAFHTELESWSSTPGGGLLAALRHTIQSLLLWSSASASSADMSPPHYTHRQLVETLNVLGAKAVLLLLLDETMAHYDTSSNPDVDMALDIIVTMIATPQRQFPLSLTGGSPHPPKPQLSLRDALAAELAGAFDLSKTNLPRATMIVRIHRRVEALVGGHAGEVGNIVGVSDNADAVLLQQGVVHDADGMPTADIDDVLGEAGNKIARDILGVV